MLTFFEILKNNTHQIKPNGNVFNCLKDSNMNDSKMKRDVEEMRGDLPAEGVHRRFCRGNCAQKICRGNSA
jgi:hypothetical protein